MTIANIEAWHDSGRCGDSYDACGCFDRLLSFLRGEPDPCGEYYRWPVYNFNLRAPRLDEWRAMGRTEFTVEERISESMLVNAEEMIKLMMQEGPPQFHMVGLRAH